MTSALVSQSRTGAQGSKAQNQLVALVFLLGLTAVATGQPLTWPQFLVSRDGFPPDVVSAVEHVWNEPTLRRTVQGPPARAPFDVYLAFVDTPDVTAAAARFRKLARYEVEPLDGDRYVADDRDGARGMYRVLVREPNRRVMVSWGQHSGRILGTISGSALTVLDLTPRDDAVEQTLTAYVRIDHRVAAVIARLLIPLFGYLADRKLVEGIGVSAAVAEWAVERPAEFCAWLAQEPLHPERRARILAALPACEGQRSRHDSGPHAWGSLHSDVGSHNLAISRIFFSYDLTARRSATISLGRLPPAFQSPRDARATARAGVSARAVLF